MKCRDRFDRNCVTYRQHRTSNTHRAEHIENALMVDPFKSCTEINLHDPNLLLTLQCTLKCMGYAQKYITGTQTFPQQTGGWMHTTAFQKSSNTNRLQALKHLRQYWCYGNRSKLATDEENGPFRFGVTFTCIQQAGNFADEQATDTLH